MKIINILVVLMSLIILATPMTYGLVEYDGLPSAPYVIYGQVLYKGSPASGLSMSVDNFNTGYHEEFKVTAEGFYQLDAMNWLTTSSVRYPVQGGDQITVKVLDGCGNNDVCEKTFTVGVDPNKMLANVGFEITGTLSCPICPSTTCGSCGGGGSGSYVVYKANQEVCDADFPCAVEDDCEVCKECEAEQVCDISTVCDEKVCQDIVCDDQTCPGQDNLGFILALIAGFVAVMGGGIQIYKNRKGGITMLHRHKGILGYHNLNTTHRNVDYRHASFEQNPTQFVKDLKRINNQ